MRRHADLERHRHPAPRVAALGLAALLAGCGGGGGGGADAQRLARACTDTRAALDRVGPVVRAADALPALRAVLAAERAALAAVLASAGTDDPLAAEFRGAIAATERTRASVAADPLRSRTMSPVGTVVPSTRRAIAAAKGLTDELCARS